ncbi:hypothetical protein Cgig2_016389 [Carnegiea gigantea]|uniref:Reverse transcriptase zinc-binding domain-containing protein n=1 Tax=Carnegiea gigantea TaxID=171969 RepID=A0A9Q1QDU5_9CARY|nr:hypothetical protein Cgig2_016389 [Carnegiea gigantea]
MQEFPLGGQSRFLNYPQSCLGIGLSRLRNAEVWNKALIAKLVWAIENKKDLLWVKWVHGRYLKNKNWWNYSPPLDCSWYWKKICFIKEFFKGESPPTQWIWKDKPYKVSTSYKWQLGDHPKKPWSKLIWNRSIIPRHAFITWLYAQRRLPIKTRLARYTGQNTLCSLCLSGEEDDQHSFLTVIMPRRYGGT